MPISQKQRQIMAFPFTHFDALIADGAIRSGKTSFMMLAFVDDAMRRYNGQRFAICGKTVDSTVKNIVVPYLGVNWAQDKYNLSWRRADKVLLVSDGKHQNIFEVFGGKDESSFSLIQGRTLAGVLFDEVALMPRSFVEQVRGVDSTSTVQTLLQKGLIEEAGRLDLPGRPISFRTTDAFLRSFGLESLAQLPPLHGGDYMLEPEMQAAGPQKNGAEDGIQE